MSIVPKYCRQKRTGRPDVAYVRINGRRHYLGLYDSPASREKYARLILPPEPEEPETPIVAPAAPSENATLSELMRLYLIHAKAYYGSKSTELAHYKAVFRVLRRSCGAVRATDFGPRLFKAVRQAMVDEQDWSRRYVNDQAGRIKRFIKWAVEEELLPGSSYHALQAIRGLARGRSAARETEAIRPVPDEVVEATLQHLPQVVADMVRVQRATGMRAGELAQMRPCDIDRSGEIWLYRPRQHKTQHCGKVRVIAIGPQAQQVLLHYLARAEEMHLFRPCDSEAKRLAAREAARQTPAGQGNSRGTNRVAQPQRVAGEVYSVAAYRRAITRAARKAKVDHWTTHQLRHAAATQVRKELGLDYVQALLGHSTARVSELYAELDTLKAVEVAKRLG